VTTFRSAPSDGAPTAPLGPVRSDIARAKVNLTLEIKGKRQDGYHELESLVLFADFGDQVEFDPAEHFSLTVSGPFGGALEGRNLIEAAAHLFASETKTEAGGAFRLTKRLPVAAGLGGGSADAAAALRLLADESGTAGMASLMAIAGKIGADVPCCLHSCAAIMTGIGEKLHPLPPVEAIPAVLVNPMVPLMTRAVFQELAAAPMDGFPREPARPKSVQPADLIAYAQASTNDLEAPARRLSPIIGDVLAVLRVAPGALLSRLSGSGPTCFALFASRAEASAAAASIGREHPAWWVQDVCLS
jgi:4-diphosphocytidyl-2-C-methyl-D-erythritol kinase